MIGACAMLGLGRNAIKKTYHTQMNKLSGFRFIKVKTTSFNEIACALKGHVNDSLKMTNIHSIKARKFS